MDMPLRAVTARLTFEKNVSPSDYQFDAKFVTSIAKVEESQTLWTMLFWRIQDDLYHVCWLSEKGPKSLYRLNTPFVVYGDPARIIARGQVVGVPDETPQANVDGRG